MTNYVRYLKRRKPLDESVLLLLSLKIPYASLKPRKLTMDEVAQILGISPRTVFNAVERHRKVYEEYVK